MLVAISESSFIEHKTDFFNSNNSFNLKLGWKPEQLPANL